ncbi:MAG: hypothetical protein R3268_00075 [Acidiferrobacterales bacterium]|nr:hypothetical protein [Acidiferrobacterales bacterium]
MATFQERVEDYIGTIDDTTGVDQFLKDSIQDVVRNMSPDLCAKYAQRSLLTSSSGFGVRGKRVLSVARRFEGQQITAREISPGEAWKATDEHGLHKATNRSPVFWIQVTAADTRLFVKPDPASGAEADIAFVQFPSPDADTDTSAVGLPVVAEDAVVLSTAMKVLTRRISDHIGEEDREMAAATEAQLARVASLYQAQTESLREAQ